MAYGSGKQQVAHKVLDCCQHILKASGSHGIEVPIFVADLSICFLANDGVS